MKKNNSYLIIALFLAVSTTVFGQKSKPLFGKGISYMNSDSTLSVKFNLRLQHLYAISYDQIDKEWSSQFLIRRARLKFGGYALTPKLKYKVELGLSNRDLSVSNEDGNGKGASRVILDAVLKWQFSKNWQLWVGQTKLPGNRERVISSANLQFVNRSLVNSRFNLDRDMGIQLRGKYYLGKVILAPMFAFSQGEGRDITSDNFGGFDYTAHLDILPLGKFTKKGDYFSADLFREQKPKIAFGFTYDFNSGAVRQGGQLGSFVRDSLGVYAENSLTTFMADMIFKYQGFSFMAEYASKSSDLQIERLSKGFKTGNGFVMNAGYLFKNNFEIALRYTSIRKLDDFSALKNENEMTLGFSKYIVGHNLKIQADISKTTILGNSNGNIRFRTQVEMQF